LPDVPKRGDVDATQERAERKEAPDAFSLRLDPKFRFAAELAAAKERRSLSSLMESSLAQTLRKIMVAAQAGEEISAMQVADQVWDADEARRLMLMAVRFPALSYFRATAPAHSDRAQPVLFPGVTRKTVRLDYDQLRFVDWSAVHDSWGKLKQVAAGLLPESELPRSVAVSKEKGKVSNKTAQAPSDPTGTERSVQVGGGSASRGTRKRNG
jgi:hypothetical protein